MNRWYKLSSNPVKPNTRLKASKRQLSKAAPQADPRRRCQSTVCVRKAGYSRRLCLSGRCCNCQRCKRHTCCTECLEAHQAQGCAGVRSRASRAAPL